MDKLKEQFETDENVKAVKKTVPPILRALPSATVHYLVEKVPIVQWLPNYAPKWIVLDFIAGLTIGAMMIPQALAYAKIATIPGEFGLYSSWIPAAFYVVMGTSKELSTGPTSIMGLLTAGIIEDLQQDGYTPQAIASAVAFMVGIYALVLGLLKLGFVLDYISVPVLSGFLSAAALTILLGQVGSLVGLSDVPSGAAAIIHDVLSRIPEFDGLTCVIGFSGIAILFALQFVGKKWGKKSTILKFVSSSRAVIVLIIFTIISYLVNRNREEPLWSISKVTANGIIPPRVPDTQLIQKAATRAVAPLVASALEHLAIGRAFGRRNGYAIDTSQELCYLGLTNTVNSLFGAMSVGGAMSRTAVNSECGVKSPLNGLVTAAFILLTLYKLSPALFWIPKATLSAIIIMAVVHLIGPATLFYRYWRISFIDFVAAMLSFWITLFVSTEIGIAVAVGFSVAYTMLRSVFVRVRIRSSLDNQDWALPRTAIGHMSAREEEELSVPSDIIVVRFTDAIFFPNANRVKMAALESVQTLYDTPATHKSVSDDDRSWSVAEEKRIGRLRKRRGIRSAFGALSAMVWDFGLVPFVDVTGVLALAELKEEVRRHAGRDVETRFVGMSDKVRTRFARAQWRTVTLDEDRFGESSADVVYPSIETALWGRLDVREDNDALELKR